MFTQLLYRFLEPVHLGWARLLVDRSDFGGGRWSGKGEVEQANNEYQAGEKVGTTPDSPAPSPS